MSISNLTWVKRALEWPNTRYQDTFNIDFGGRRYEFASWNQLTQVGKRFPQRRKLIDHPSNHNLFTQKARRLSVIPYLERFTQFQETRETSQNCSIGNMRYTSNSESIVEVKEYIGHHKALLYATELRPKFIGVGLVMFSFFKYTRMSPRPIL
jgi:hypothetical protein